MILGDRSFLDGEGRSLIFETHSCVAITYFSDYTVITNSEQSVSVNPVVKTRIVKIGNSQGIRIPKLLLEQLHLSDEVELEVQQNQLIIRPARSVRQGWDEAFQKMAEQGDDQLLDQEATSLTSWDADEWEW